MKTLTLKSQPTMGNVLILVASDPPPSGYETIAPRVHVLTVTGPVRMALRVEDDDAEWAEYEGVAVADRIEQLDT